MDQATQTSDNCKSENEEVIRRQMVEATRLASLTPGEWRLWIDDRAEQLGVPRATLEKLVLAIIADREKNEREAKIEARRQEQRIEKKRKERERERQKALKALSKRPSKHLEPELAELAKRFKESIEAIRVDFTTFAGAGSEGAFLNLWAVEPWPEPVKTQALLQEVAAKIRKHVVLRPEGITAATLWTLGAWIHEVAAIHSPILAAVSVEPDSGKTTLLAVLQFIVPKPFVSVEPTGPSVYRTVDRDHPTLVIDEADDLFQRKSDLRAIINAGWSRGTRIPRQGYWFDPFCPKILGVLGKTKLPRTVASRSIILRMWPKKADETVVDFAYSDDNEFATVRRKLARWAADNGDAIKELQPPQPPGFNNRLSANWRLLLQIAQHAGDDWPEKARRAAVSLSRAPFESSWGVQLLGAMRVMFANRAQITSQEVVDGLLADPDSLWHEYRGRGPITKHQVAALLKDFEIRPVVVHPTRRATLSRHGYRTAQFEDVFARFLPPEPNIRTQRRGLRRK
jgi:hypothetical protein